MSSRITHFQKHGHVVKPHSAESKSTTRRGNGIHLHTLILSLMLVRLMNVILSQLFHKSWEKPFPTRQKMHNFCRVVHLFAPLQFSRGMCCCCMVCEVQPSFREGQAKGREEQRRESGTYFSLCSSRRRRNEDVQGKTQTSRRQTGQTGT